MINIDFGSQDIGPLDSYAAAGVPGFWNVFDSLPVQQRGELPLVLRDNAGNLTNIRISTRQSLFDVTPSGNPVEGPHGALLGDYIVHIRSSFEIELSGLKNGVYELITYSIGRQDVSQPSMIEVTPFGDSALTKATSGVYAGQLEEGVTHATHRLNVSDQKFFFEVMNPRGDGFLNGFQLTLVPEPSAVILFLGGSLVMSLFRRRYF